MTEEVEMNSQQQYYCENCEQNVQLERFREIPICEICGGHNIFIIDLQYCTQCGKKLIVGQSDYLEFGGQFFCKKCQDSWPPQELQEIKQLIKNGELK